MIKSKLKHEARVLNFSPFVSIRETLKIKMIRAYNFCFFTTRTIYYDVLRVTRVTHMR